MAEQQASSRTVVRMPTRFMNTNSDHGRAVASHNYAVYTASSTAATATTSTGQATPASLGMNRVYVTGEGMEAVRSTVGMRPAHGYYDTRPINTFVDTASRERERATSIATASTRQQHDHTPPSTNTPRDCWAAGGIRGTHEWVQHEALQVGSAAPPATRWVRLAWEPLVAGDEVPAGPSTTSYPPVAAGGGVPVTGGAITTTTRGGLPPSLGYYSRQHLGVKRFRAPDEEYRSNIDDQGVEAKRVGSPHRLIRRIPTKRREGGREQPPTSLAPQPCSTPSRNSGSTLGVGMTGEAARPGAHHHALPWMWAGAAHVTGPSRDRGRPSETVSSGRYEAERRHWQWNGANVPSTTFQQQLFMPPAQSPSSSGGAAYHHPPAVLSRVPREEETYRHHREAESSRAVESSTLQQHHSLKVQRLGMGQIDTLASSVESLGVASPGARGQTAENGSALDDAMLRRAYSRRRQTYGESTTANNNCVPTSVDNSQHPIAAGALQTSIIGPTRRGGWVPSGHGASAARADSVTDESNIGGGDGSRVSLGGASRDEDGGHHTVTVQKATGTPSAALTMPADNRTPPQPTALPILPTPPRVTSEAGTVGWSTRGVTAGNSTVVANTKEGLRTMDVDNAAATAVMNCCSCAPAVSSSGGVSCSRTASPLGRALQGRKSGAPGYDAAVSTASCGAAGESGTLEASAAGRGDVDDDSSDGGAAHEEISAWLHSTEDWWTS